MTIPIWLFAAVVATSPLIYILFFRKPDTSCYGVNPLELIYAALALSWLFFVAAIYFAVLFLMGAA